MAELVIAVLELLLELLIEVGLNWPVAEADPANRRHITLSLFWQCFLYAVIGCMLAVISLYFFPFTWIKNPQLQVLNLLLAPVLAALAAYWFAKKELVSSSFVSPSTRAWKSYCLTLALVLVRYTFGKHA